MTTENSIIEPYTSVAELQAIFASQRSAYNNNKYPAVSERITQLQHLKATVMSNQEALIAAISKDFGHRCADETRISELLTFVESVDSSIKHIKRWTKPSVRKVAIIFQPASNKVLYQPLGVVGIMVPWNYPLILSLSPLVTALTAGNRVMLKLSEYTPHFNQCLKKLLSEVFTTEQAAVTTGESDVSTAFSRLPFNHLFLRAPLVLVS